MSLLLCRRRVISLLFGAFVSGKAAASDELSLDAFRDLVIAVGRRRFPTMSFVPGNGLVRSGEHTLYLDNIYIIVKQIPPDLREAAIVEWLSHFTPEADAKADAVKRSIADWSTARLLLRPKLMNRATAKRSPQLITRPFVGDLFIAYSIDLGDKDLYVADDRFAPWNVSVDRVHDAAIENLEAMSTMIPVEPRR